MEDGQSETAREQGRAISYEMFLEYRNHLIRTGQEQTASLDRHILALASSAIGLSFVVMKDHASQEIHLPYLFFTSLALLVLSMLSTLVSFYISRRSCDDMRKRWDEWWSQGAAAGTMPGATSLARWVRKVNAVSIVTFLLGVVLLSWFISRNVVFTGS